ncbi:hypothetical protein Tco_0442459 [Tanacetum coccineum]
MEEVEVVVVTVKMDLRDFQEVVSLVDVVLDGAFGGVGEEEVVVGDGVERFSLSLRLVYPWKFEVKENVSGEEIEKSS